MPLEIHTTVVPHQPRNPKVARRFANREEAGRILARQLGGFSERKDVIVLAMPNGGVLVGAEVAALLDKPFDVLFVGKITAPGSGGLPLGAITAGGVRTLNSAMIDRLHLSPEEISNAVLQGSRKLARREKHCRGHYPSVEIADHTVILVDDGTTACEVMRDAVRLLRRQHADHVIVALPVACHHTVCDLRMEADDVITLAEPATPRTAGKWYKEFPRMTDTEVRHLLAGRHPDAGTGN